MEVRVRCISRWSFQPPPPLPSLQFANFKSAPSQEFDEIAWSDQM